MNAEFLPLKKIYYYAICLLAVFILTWGGIDLASSAISLAFLPSPPPESAASGIENVSPDNSGPAAKSQSIENYYQRSMLLDRFGDSLARVIIAGAVFAFCRIKINRLEGEEKHGA
ncbi:MAG: hypothetical protein WC901_01535 [Candidatus Margulisiibacteriota bacterium]